jgi:RNA polymerase sigma factor (sigma-70 family)
LAKNVDDAEDIAGEAMLAIVQAKRPFPTEGEFKAYVRKSVQTQLYKHRSWVLVPDKYDVAREEPAPWKKELPELLRRGIEERLEPNERAVIRGSFVEGKTQEEIAANLGVTRERVSQIKSKAVEKLRTYFKGCEDGCFR